MGNDFEAGNGQDKWDRVAAELRACRESQQKAYGDIDSTTLGRYLAGESGPEEAARVEAALNELPELRALTDIVSDVLCGLGPATEDAPAASEITAKPAAAVLPFKPAAPRKPVSGFWQRYSAVLAAACLLVAVGAGSVLLSGGPSPDATTGPPATGNGFAGKGGADRMLASLDLGPGLTVEELQKTSEVAIKAVPAPVQPPQPDDKRGALMRWLSGGPRGEKNPYTRQVALYYNQAVLSAPAGGKGGYAHSLACLPAEIDGAQVAYARKDVVRPLAEALCIAKDAKKGRHIATALGQLGPASAEAMTVLVHKLVRSDDPHERQAVLVALENIGPAARDALPKLQEAVVSGKFAGKKANHAHVRRLVHSLNTSPRWRVGVYDPAGKTSVRAARKTTQAFRVMAEKHDVEVFVDVRHPSSICRHKCPAERLKEMGKKAVVVVLDVDSCAVEVCPSKALRGRVSAEAASRAIRAALIDQGCDEAVTATYERLASALEK